MDDIKTTLKDSIIVGSCAAVLSGLALVAFGRREQGEALGPVNAVSHWLWGDEALHQDDASAKHTVVGYVIHHGASLLWGTVHMLLWRKRQQMLREREAEGAETEAAEEDRIEPVPLAAHAIATSALACFVDFQMTPQRLTPGFEHRLDHAQLAGVYGAFALGLVLGTVLVSRRR